MFFAFAGRTGAPVRGPGLGGCFDPILTPTWGPGGDRFPGSTQGRACPGLQPGPVGREGADLGNLSVSYQDLNLKAARMPVTNKTFS